MKGEAINTKILTLSKEEVLTAIAKRAMDYEQYHNEMYTTDN